MIRQDETKSFTDDITSCVRFFDSGASLVVIKVRKLQSPSTPAFNGAKSCEKDEDDGILLLARALVVHVDFFFFQMPQEVFCAVHVGWVSNFWVMYYNAELLAYLSSCGGKEPE